VTDLVYIIDVVIDYPTVGLALTVTHLNSDNSPIHIGLQDFRRRVTAKEPFLGLSLAAVLLTKDVSAVLAPSPTSPQSLQAPTTPEALASQQCVRIFLVALLSCSILQNKSLRSAHHFYSPQHSQRSISREIFNF
jgi:hypothetical protein